MSFQLGFIVAAPYRCQWRAAVSAANTAAGGQRVVAHEDARMEAGTPRTGDNTDRLSPVAVFPARWRQQPPSRATVCWQWVRRSHAYT